MSLGDHLILYCERHGPEPFAEPLNALSNLAFFYFAWRLWSDAGQEKAPSIAARMRWLAVLIALVGIGSVAFHTFATAWARILDLAFIGIFNVLYLFFFLESVARWPRRWVFVAAAGFLVVDRMAAMLGLANVLQGSGTYLPAVSALLALTLYALRIAPRAGHMMAGASAVFLFSLTARTIDLLACSSWPWGTHFLWHLFNAWVLYRLSRALQIGSGGRNIEHELD